MKNGPTYFKWSVVLILGVLVFIFGKSCNCNGGKGTVRTDTISVRHDTIIHKVDTIVQLKQVPYKVVTHDTLEMEVEGKPVYYPIDQYPPAIQKMLTEYNSTKYYKDSISIKYGKVYKADTLRWNRIIGSSLSTNLSIPEITHTVTLQAPRRTLGLIGAEIWGNKGTPLFFTGISAGWQSKRQKIFLLKAALDKNGNMWYGGQYILPIHLRK